MMRHPAPVGAGFPVQCRDSERPAAPSAPQPWNQTHQAALEGSVTHTHTPHTTAHTQLPPSHTQHHSTHITPSHPTHTQHHSAHITPSLTHTHPTPQCTHTPSLTHTQH